MKQPWEDEDDPPVDVPTWEELQAFDDYLRERERHLRKIKLFARSFANTDLLESLHAKMHRLHHRHFPPRD